QVVQPRHGLAIQRLEAGPEVRRGADGGPDRVGPPPVAPRLFRRLGLFDRFRLLVLVLGIAGTRVLLGAEQALLDVVVRRREVGEHAVHVEADAEAHAETPMWELRLNLIGVHFVRRRGADGIGAPHAPLPARPLAAGAGVAPFAGEERHERRHDGYWRAA